MPSPVGDGNSTFGIAEFREGGDGAKPAGPGPDRAMQRGVSRGCSRW